jgi:hypothetical protein
LFAARLECKFLALPWVLGNLNTDACTGLMLFYLGYWLLGTTKMHVLSWTLRCWISHKAFSSFYKKAISFALF